MIEASSDARRASLAEPGADCVVVGGGPAGSVLAGRLAELGHSVILLHDGASGQPPRGESLPPGALSILRSTGVLDRLLPLTTTSGSLLSWGADHAVAFSASERPTFAVDREHLNGLMRDAAAERGVRILESARFIDAVKGPGGAWTIRAIGPAGGISATARMLAIAAGRRAPLGGRRRRLGPPTLALYARLHGPDARIGESRIEACADAWVWGTPLADGTTCAAVFVDPGHAIRGTGIEGCFRSILSMSRLLRRLAQAPIAGSISACDATRSASSPLDGDLIRVGEASFAVDPLSSQGVLQAVASGLQGASAINTLLRFPERRTAVTRFCLARQGEALAHDSEIASAYYGEQARVAPTRFWRKRASAARPADIRPTAANGSADAALVLAKDAVIAPEPVIENELITMRPALHHPGLQRPMAFARNVPIDVLVTAPSTAQRPTEIVRRWAEHLSDTDAWALLRLLERKGVLVPAVSAANQT